jgi:hypothetical protein
MKRVRLFTLFLLLLTLATAAPAAPRSSADRRMAYEQGTAALEAKNWEEAYRIFSSLWAEQQTYDVALSLGNAELRLRKYAAAAAHLTFALENFPPAESRELGERATKALDRAKQEVGAVTLIVDQPGASVQMDGKVIGQTPLPSVLYIDPGHHVVEATLSGYQPVKQEFDAKSGEALSLALKLDPVAGAAATSALPPASTSEPQPAVPPAGTEQPASRGSGKGKTIAMIAGGAVFVIAATTGLIYSGKASSAEDRAEEQVAIAKHQGNPCSSSAVNANACLEARRAFEDRNNAARVQNVAFAVAGVSAAATAVLFFAWPSKRAQSARSARLRPVADFTSAGVTLSGAF